MTPPVSWTVLGPVADHLWQSTLVAAAAWLLARGLHGAPARVRSLIWATASAKFLVPAVVLTGLGRLAARVVPPAGGLMPTSVASLTDAVSQPFSRLALPVTEPASLAWAAPEPASIVPTLIVVAWCAGALFVAGRWLARWCQVRRLVQGATRVTEGAVAEALRTAARHAGLRREPALAVTPSAVEPGVYGVRRPVLLWPRDMEARLTTPQLAAVLAHEVAHVARRDNLVAAVHLMVEALFWFHPAVWRIGERMLHERERACDEAVLAMGAARTDYAEGLLTTCEHCLETSLACVAGVSGSTLSARVEAIMTAPRHLALSRTTRMALVGGIVVLVAGPVSVGALTANSTPTRLATTGRLAVLFGAPPQQAAVPAPQGPMSFEVASVKRNDSRDAAVRFQIQPGGRFQAVNTPAEEIIRAAYQLQRFQIVGGPDWIRDDRYDIVAKADADFPPAAPGQAGPLQLMLQSLLAERFGLRVSREERDMPIYALRLARQDGGLGDGLRPSALDCAAGGPRRGGPPPAAAPGQPLPCGLRIGPGAISGGGMGLSQLVSALSPVVGRVVADRTDLGGAFDIDLTWTPDRMAGGGVGPLEPSPPDPNGVSIFTALQEQLGLRLEATRGPVSVLVIDSIDRPTPD
ncbi:MAG: TIGR03435 family protein [Vicinamibacterales bacterium]